MITKEQVYEALTNATIRKSQLTLSTWVWSMIVKSMMVIM
jgi:hypothetical protein